MGFTPEERAQFERLYKSAQSTASDSNLQIVKKKDEMISILVQGAEARQKYIHPKAMVPHKKNRGGSKMQWSKIYGKGAKILKVGVSLNECGPDKAVAFEIEDTKETAKDHIKLCQTSEHYACYEDADLVEASTVGCGHWNQFLACILDKRPVPNAHRAALCEAGNPCLDPVRLARDQPVLEALLNTGLKVTLIKRKIKIIYPLLPSILQKALNVEHNIGEGSSICFRKCYRIFSFRFLLNPILQSTIVEYPCTHVKILYRYVDVRARFMLCCDGMALL